MEEEKDFYIDEGCPTLNKSMMGLGDDEDYGDDLFKSRESLYSDGFIKMNALMRHMQKAEENKKKGTGKMLGMAIRD